MSPSTSNDLKHDMLEKVLTLTVKNLQMSDWTEVNRDT
jgi:hypothetical protein